ncbi:conserved hypothetical protein [Lutispora thermophila DSM 19022]|uniref:Purine nucleoside phosphorylase n=2 Tax=Lutispora TaxID=667112 RepID=A0A1M6CNV2_9FIRM|nr:conserved hypothetical protein [Lutispora thermophila DSM 19022]
MAFEINKSGNLIYLTIPEFSNTGIVRHCFTTKQGGVSKGIYASLNTSPFKDEPIEVTNKNLDLVCSAIGIDYKKLIMSKQVHGDNVLIVDENFLKKKSSHDQPIQGYDALVTNLPNVPLMTFYADCVPIYLLDPVNKAIGLVHSGWRSTVLHIVKKTIEKMKMIYNTKPEDLLAAIGPSIEKDCFEVDEDAAEMFRRNFSNHSDIVFDKSSGKYLIDLWAANRKLLLESGVRQYNINESRMCTKCNDDLFFSYRRNKGRNGSMSAIMGLYY